MFDSRQIVGDGAGEVVSRAAALNSWCGSRMATAGGARCISLPGQRADQPLAAAALRSADDIGTEGHGHWLVGVLLITSRRQRANGLDFKRVTVRIMVDRYLIRADGTGQAVWRRQEWHPSGLRFSSALYSPFTVSAKALSLAVALAAHRRFDAGFCQAFAVLYRPYCKPLSLWWTSSFRSG